MHNFLRTASAVLILCFTLTPLGAEKPVRIVGSTAVYAFSTAVAERVGAMTEFSASVVEATGTGGGFNIFCGKSGPSSPAVANASRPISIEEKRVCQHNGHDILELKIGYDGIVIGINPSQEPFDVSLSELSQALSEYVEKESKWVKNPHKTWNSIHPRLPSFKISVLGPTTTLATREVFEEKVIKKGCQRFARDQKGCHKSIREDGVFNEVAEHENVIVQKLRLKPQAIGFVSFGFYHQNPNQIKPLAVEGVLPTVQTISDQSYPLSRPLYIYIKVDQLKKDPALQAFVEELFSDPASGPEGYLVDKGLIPLPDNERKAMKAKLALVKS